MKTARNMLITVLLGVLLAIGLINANQPGTGNYADDCITPAYVEAHKSSGVRYGCAFVRVSLGQFGSPTSQIPSGLVMLGLLSLPIMTVGAGLGARRQYRK